MATIKSKIIINVCIVLAIVIGIVGMNFFDLRELKQMQDDGYQRSTDSILAKEASMEGMKLYEIIADAVINRHLAETDKEWASAKDVALKSIDATIKAADTPEEKKIVDEVKYHLQEIISLFEGKMLPLLKSTDGVTPEIRSIDEQLDVHVRAVEEKMDRFVASLEKEMKAADDEFDADVRSALTETLIIGLLGILLQAGLATWLIRQVLRPIHAMVAMLQDVAEGEGDLTKRLDNSRNDEIAAASAWFNKFIEKIQQIVGQVATTSTQLASAATQLHANSEQIATGTEEVACQTGTVATASEEMAATSGDIAQTCHQAADSAKLASDSALSGASVVQGTVTGMAKISSRVQETAKTVESLGARSDQIGTIIATIEEIADQTNLLALNAAIEAARAGEQGRGFAVVADEVRALAERTTRATKEIGNMIKSIQQETQTAVSAMEEGVHEVEQGMQAAKKSGDALAEILEQINSVTSQVALIATAAEQQTATTNEITKNIQQVTDVVRTTAKGAMDSAEGAFSVNQLATELHTLVHRFKV